MLRVIALATFPALLMSAAVSPSLAAGQDTKQEAVKPADKQEAAKPAEQKKKPAMRSRGFHPASPSVEEAAPGAVPPASPPADGGSAEDTIGGLPGHSSGPGLDKQP